MKEKVIPIRIKREKEETKSINEIRKQLNDDDEDIKFEEEIEEVMRLGPYIGGARPIKLRLLARTYKLTRDIEEYKDVFI